jgi:hypothetical protein
LYSWLKRERITEEQILERLTKVEAFDKEEEKSVSSSKHIPFSLLIGIWRFTSRLEIKVSTFLKWLPRVSKSRERDLDLRRCGIGAGDGWNYF